MLTNLKKKANITNRTENFEGDNREFENDDFDTNIVYERSNYALLSDNGESGLNTNEQPYEDQTNNHLLQSTKVWSSPFSVKKCWNYQSVLNDGAHPRIKISTKSKSKKSKNKKSRHDPPQYGNIISSLHNPNSLKTRLKIGYGKSSGKKKKLSVSIINNSYNGLSSVSSVADDDNYENNVVPSQPNIDTGSQSNHYNDGQEEAEYAQYLELKPSVKFKCCRCGTNDFNTMGMLQEHMARCDGQPLFPVTANSSLERSKSPYESPYHPVARNLKIKRKVLLCSSCGTYYQHYNLYVHMRDKHNKEICLFCRNTFSKPQQLWDHLIAAHSLNSVVYSDVAQVREAFKSFFITCCSCNRVFSDEDKFSEHKCNSQVDKIEERDSLFTGFKPVSQFQPTNDELLTREHADSADDVEKENETATCSTLDVIGVGEQRSCDSATEQMEAADSTTAPDMPVHEPVEDHENQKSPAVSQPPVLDNDGKSPSISLSEENDPVAKVLANDTTEQQPLPDPPFEDEKSTIEPLVNENGLLLKNEEKTSGWLETDDETENTPAILLRNEIAVPEVEALPQPVAMALMLDEMVSSLSVETIIKECVRTSCTNCLYCNNATIITVNGGQLAAHLRSEHRYMPTKPEDSPEQVVQKIENAMKDLKDVFMNASLSSTYTTFVGTFACLQCSFTTTLFKDLCHHMRKMHHKLIFLCIMCKCNFMHYSQLLCHLCPGLYSPEVQNTLNYHCCFCRQDCIPSAFRLMVHLRKIHQACDICLTRYKDQSELFSHMIKQHKMNHLCYKCNLAYRSRDGINEHLFWKHGTESVLCKRCLQKKWPHAYHFCIPASTYACDECSRTFSKAVALTVHRRAHNGEFPFACNDCEQKFISKRLLTVHRRDVHGIKPEPSEADKKEEEKTEVRGDDETKAEEEQNDEDGKKRRKKKRKKEKTDIEKPILDDLPPLNLSSESEEDSAEEEATKYSALPTPEQDEAKQVKPEQTDPVDEIETKILDSDVGEPNVDELSSSKDDHTNVETEIYNSKIPVNSDKSPDSFPSKETQVTENAAQTFEKSIAEEPPPAGISIDKQEQPELPTRMPTSTECEPNAAREVLTNNKVEPTVELPTSMGAKSKLSAAEFPAPMEDTAEPPEAGILTAVKPRSEPLVATSTSTEKEFESAGMSRSVKNESEVGAVPTSTENEIQSPDTTLTNVETESAMAKMPIIIEGESKSSETISTKIGVEPTPLEEPPEVFMERIRICLIIEHSYSIPDSIFHSEAPDAGTSLEALAQKLSSPRPCSKPRDKSCSKSVTPRKRKRPTKRESSTSDSSTDSDSSSSSCGSNCSCNQKSNSNCSSSSSDSEYSTTPDKKHSKSSANETREMDTTATNDEEESKKQQYSLLNVRESDLDTDVETSDEDFYDKYPSLMTRVEENKSEPPPLPLPTIPSALPFQSLSKKESSSRKNRKRRRAPKITISLGSNKNNMVATSNLSVNLHRLECHRSTQQDVLPTYKHAAMNDARPGIHLCKTNSGSTYTSVANSVSNNTSMSRVNVSAAGDAAVRSKRERVKNRFYGYSSSDEAGANEPIKPVMIKKRAAPKRPSKPPVNKPFVGIRAKKPLIMPPKRPPSSATSVSKTMASTHPSLPPHLYRMPSYIMQQQQKQQQILQRQQQYQQSYQKPESSSSSDDSDSDNLVINEPSLNESLVNNHPNYQFPTYPASSNWQNISQFPFAGTPMPGQSNERLYCFCRCPYDEVSEMIACDGENCEIEWFHFECVGIMVPPKGKWYCPKCI